MYLYMYALYHSLSWVRPINLRILYTPCERSFSGYYADPKIVLGLSVYARLLGTYTEYVIAYVPLWTSISRYCANPRIVLRLSVYALLVDT